ncbi:uncharacterized protein LOC125020268 isoform X2 [Mugil cephalus]|uniref:uncharacterized protein LOC125020268 isoform X2 n=1 Tax=Mugil cephalus TaxID=48193 RepID=UPI001FB726CF|nr:uncharacterized protein LOC125020268 isoform X2 [Mugil cephalus]
MRSDDWIISDMRLNVYICLLLFVLASNVFAGLIHKAVEEKVTVTIDCCRHCVKNKVTWSRIRDGRKVDILTVDGDRDIKHIKDPDKRFSSLADKSLVIIRADVSDSGVYLCDDKPAVNLTVIPSGRKKVTTPSPTTTIESSHRENTGLIHREVEEKQIVTIRCCRHCVKNKVTWSRIRDRVKVDILTIDGDRYIKHIKDPDKRFSSLADKSLVIIRADVSDSGVYLCDDEEAVELTVISSGKKTPTFATAPLLENSAPSDLWPVCVRTVVVVIYLFTMISITAATWRKAGQIQNQKRPSAERGTDP